jgi:hypothetical protein
MGFPLHLPRGKPAAVIDAPPQAGGTLHVDGMMLADCRLLICEVTERGEFFLFPSTIKSLVNQSGLTRMD